MSLQLLPSGGFLIGLEDGTQINGKFDGAAFRRLSLKLNLEFSEVYDKLITGNDLLIYHHLIHCAVNDTKYDIFDVMDWISVLDGFDGEDGQKLLTHSFSGYISKKKIIPVT